MAAYVTQYNHRHNYASLKAITNDIIFLTEDEYMPLPLPSHDYNHAIVDGIYKELENFDDSEDFIVPVGSPITIGIAFAALQAFGIGEFNALKWNNQTNRYDVAKVFLTETGDYE